MIPHKLLFYTQCKIHELDNKGINKIPAKKDTKPEIYSIDFESEDEADKALEDFRKVVKEWVLNLNNQKKLNQNG